MSSAVWHCSAGQLLGLRGPDLARESLIDDIWCIAFGIVWYVAKC